MPNHSSARPRPPKEASDSFKFHKQLRQLQEAFPNWTNDDLETLLIETNGDVQLASTKIIDAVAVQWGQVSRRPEETQAKKGRRRRKNRGGATIHRAGSSHPASIDPDDGFARGADSESAVEDHHEICATTSVSTSGWAEPFSTSATSFSVAPVWGSAARSNAASDVNGPPVRARVTIPPKTANSKLRWSQIVRKQQDKASPVPESSTPNEEATQKLVWEELTTVQDLIWDDEHGHEAPAVSLPHPVNEKAKRKSVPKQETHTLNLPRPRPERSQSSLPADTEPPKPTAAAKPSRRMPSRSAAIVRPPSGPPVVISSSFVPFDTGRMQFGSLGLGGEASDDTPEPQPYHLGPKEPMVPGPKEPVAPGPQEMLGETKTHSEPPPRSAAPRVNTDFLLAIFREEHRRQRRGDREPIRRATPLLAQAHDDTANSVVEPIHLTQSTTPPHLQQELTAQEEPPILMSDHQGQRPARGHTPQQPQQLPEQQDLASERDQREEYSHHEQPHPQLPSSPPGFFDGQNDTISASAVNVGTSQPNFYDPYSQHQAHFGGRNFPPSGHSVFQGSVRAVRPQPPPRPPPALQQHQTNTPMQQPPHHQGRSPPVPVYFTPYRPEAHSLQSAPHIPGHDAPQLFVMYPVVQGPSGHSMVPAPAPRQRGGNPGGPQLFEYPQVVYQEHSLPSHPGFQPHPPNGPHMHDLSHGRGVFGVAKYGFQPAVMYGPPGQPGMQGFAYDHAGPSGGPCVMHDGLNRSGSSSGAGPGVGGNVGVVPAHGGSRSLVVNVEFDTA